jgi:hypothetical protein
MREVARLDKAALFRLLAHTLHSAQHLVRDSAARVRVVASASRWGTGRYASLKLFAVPFATASESCVWIAAPRLESVDLLLELLVAVTPTLTILVYVNASEVV